MNQKYIEIYQKSIQNREEFWKEISENIFWYKKPTKILNSKNPPFYKWFEDGVTNTCYNALDLHIDNGRGDKLAIIYDSPITGTKKNITYNELKDKVAMLAGALKKQGVSKGDRVIIYELVQGNLERNVKNARAFIWCFYIFTAMVSSAAFLFVIFLHL